MQALLGAETPVVTLVGKASAYQVRVALETSREENLAMIRESVSHIREQGREVHFDAEHFFDGYREDRDYALQALRTAHRAGAEYLVLCDTNGGAMTSDILRAVAAVREALPAARLGIHCHDDCGLAVANSLAAVEAGVTQVQGCVNGYGERCGNANLTSVIANLQLKMGRPVVSDAQLGDLTNASLFVAELANLPLDGQAPYVGLSAFAHKAGYHVAAIVKDPDTYQAASTPKPSATAAASWSVSSPGSATSPSSWPSAASTSPSARRRTAPCSIASRRWRAAASSTRPRRRPSSCWPCGCDPATAPPSSSRTS